MKTITIKSMPLASVLFVLNGHQHGESWLKPAVETLATFITSNWSEITYARIAEISANTVHCDNAEKACRSVSAKIQKLSDLYKTHVVLPVLGKDRKDYLVIKRKALGQKANQKLNIRKPKVDADQALNKKMDQIVECILTRNGDKHVALTYKTICKRWNMPYLGDLVKMQGFTQRRFYNWLLPDAIRRYGQSHPDFVQAVIAKNGKRWAKKSDIDEFVDRFSERIGNACGYDSDLRCAR